MILDSLSDAVMVALRGVSAPRRSVANSTFPAAVTAAMAATESPPRPLQLPGSFRSASYSTARGTGQAAKVVTVWGRNDARPAAVHDQDFKLMRAE